MYQFKYFNDVHIKTLLFFIIVGVIIVGLPYVMKGLENTKYTIYLGFLLILVKIIDSIHRVIYENEKIVEVLPFNLCNIAIILAGLYFIKRKNILINLVYFFSPGAVLAVLLPGIGTYRSSIYPYLFMATHSLEIIAIIYSLIWLKAKITKNGLKTAIIVYLVLSVIVKIFNNIMGLNFMYLNDYIIPAVSFIKPIILYDIILVFLFILLMAIVYIPFMKKKK